MSLHRRGLVGREHTLEVVGEQLDQLLAGDIPRCGAHRGVTSRMLRRRARPRCSRTRWFSGVRSSRSHTSGAGKPWTSRSSTTARCRAGSSVSARASSVRNLGGQHPWFRPGPRRGGGLAPPSGVLVTGPAEPVGVDRGSGQLGHHDRLTPTATPRGVDQDPEDPGAQAGAALEEPQPAQHTEPGLLHDLLRGGVGPDVSAGHPQHRGRPGPHDLGEGLLVPGAQPVDQVLVLGDHVRNIAPPRQRGEGARRPGSPGSHQLRVGVHVQQGGPVGGEQLASSRRRARRGGAPGCRRRRRAAAYAAKSGLTSEVCQTG